MEQFFTFFTRKSCQKTISYCHLCFWFVLFYFFWNNVFLLNAKSSKRNTMHLESLTKMHQIFFFRGKDFRVDYGNLAVLCATFSTVPVVAMTATASKSDREFIKGSLGLKNMCRKKLLVIQTEQMLCTQNI